MLKNLQTCHKIISCAEKKIGKKEALELFCFVANITKEEFYLQKDYPLNPDVLASFEEKVKQRLSGKPFQYITNHVSFFNLELYVDERVLIPRPETELLCEMAINKIKEFFKNNNSINILDIGAGSGAISFAVASNLKKSFVYGVDISSKAIEVANLNKSKNKIENVSFVCGDVFSPFTNQSFDVIISNPPYVLSCEMEGLQKEVKQEPSLALDGGEDGLIFYRRILKDAKKYLKNKGLIIFEIHEDKGQEMCELAKEYNYSSYEVMKDYAGKDRFFVVQYDII